MMSFAAMRQEHDVLLVLANELLRLTSRQAPPCRLDLYNVRTRLASVLIRRLKTEDWIIYPELMRDEKRSDYFAIRQLQAETADLADAFEAHAKRWTTFRIEEEWLEYCGETTDLIKTLRRQVNKENRQIYGLPFASCGQGDSSPFCNARSNENRSFL